MISRIPAITCHFGEGGWGGTLDTNLIAILGTIREAVNKPHDLW